MISPSVLTENKHRLLIYLVLGFLAPIYLFLKPNLRWKFEQTNVDI